MHSESTHLPILPHFYRSWAEQVAGGGPWGPMDASYLQRAGPRLSDTELLDHFHSHTETCSICQSALRRVTAVRAVAAVVGARAAVVSLAALMLQAALPAATIPVSATAAIRLPQLAPLATGAALLALVAGLVWTWCQRTIPRFFKGQVPHARNRVPGEWTSM